MNTSVPLVHVPGVLRCAKCGFRLTKTTLNVANGTAYANEEPDTCPNCYVPMWRVSWQDEAKEAYAVAESQMDRALEAERLCNGLATALKSAIEHIEHMAAWITRTNKFRNTQAYSFESLGEDLPGIKAELTSPGAQQAANEVAP